MKSLVLVLIFLSSLSHAGEIRKYKKINSSQSEVIIQTVEHDSTQASSYVDGKENQQFIQDLLDDNTSLLFKLKQQIEKEYCGKTSTVQIRHIDGCGEVELTNDVMTSFGRGGWDSGGASYTFFMGFREEGTGHFFDVSHMVTIGESVLAETTSAGDYAGRVIKTLSFGRISRIDDHQPL